MWSYLLDFYHIIIAIYFTVWIYNPEATSRSEKLYWFVLEKHFAFYFKEGYLTSEIPLQPAALHLACESMADPAQLTLKDVLCDEELAHLFRDFLHQLHSSENLAFWLDVEDFKQISDNYPDIRRQRAKRIYQKYFSADSQSQVCIVLCYVMLTCRRA